MTVCSHVILQMDKMAASSNVTKSDRNWSFQEILDLIQEYEKYECLYNTTLREYKDREKKKAALQQIAAVFDTTADEVSSKFSKLRIYYNRERAKLTATPKSGSSAGDVNKKSTWVHFDALEFLSDFCTPRSTRSNFASTASQPQDEVAEDEETPNHYDTAIDSDVTDYQPIMEIEEDVNDLVTPRAAAPKKSTKQPTGRKCSRKQKQVDDEDIVLNKAMTALDKASRSPAMNDSTPDDIFGQYVASELKGVKDEYLKKMIKHRIHTVLFETQMPPSSPFLNQGYPGVNQTPPISFKPFDNGMAPPPPCNSSGQTQQISASQFPHKSFTAVRPTSAPPSTLLSSPPPPDFSEYSDVSEYASNSYENIYTVLN
ncbi:PREDICTED: uncharacterized protein LOC106814275 [Priapulus caudatus]|uniref:Uncharacterized protein LOC106814275 n=1 Tax=Priapulus caudatus TaxID=37621 RepID=A0ABM1EPD7_PRICU|nr:PREDICTED: uncharacterized protein LOC106814275 [Priapulus caudatus]